MSAVFALIWSLESRFHKQVEYPTHKVPADAQILDVLFGASETSAEDDKIPPALWATGGLEIIVHPLPSNPNSIPSNS